LTNSLTLSSRDFPFYNINELSKLLLNTSLSSSPIVSKDFLNFEPLEAMYLIPKLPNFYILLTRNQHTHSLAASKYHATHNSLLSEDFSTKLSAYLQRRGRWHDISVRVYLLWRHYMRPYALKFGKLFELTSFMSSDCGPAPPTPTPAPPIPLQSS